MPPISFFFFKWTSLKVSMWWFQPVHPSIRKRRDQSSQIWKTISEGMLRSITCKSFESPTNILSRTPHFPQQQNPNFIQAAAVLPSAPEVLSAFPSWRTLLHKFQPAHVTMQMSTYPICSCATTFMFICWNGHGINMYQLPSQKCHVMATETC